MIQGSSGNDVLTGGGGTTFISGGGNDAITGSGGGTTLVVPYGYRQVSVPTATGGALVTPGGTDTITGIQTISLADGRVSYDASGHAEQVTLLYQAALGRAPDQSGLSFWTTALDQGASLKALGTAFLNAPEFAARTPGASGPDNGAFVEQLYQNVLHRGSDAAGKASWVGRLNSGALTRADVLDDFALSPESQSRSVAFVSGIFVEDPVAAQIARLYDTSFGRLPDVAGLVAWKGAIEGGALTLRQVAGDFVTSPEFQAKYGALSNTDFVKALYINTLHRTADAPGLAGWTGALAGGLSRGDVVVGFSESAEHVANTASNVMGNTPATYGIHFA